MVLGWRRKKAAHRDGKKLKGNQDIEIVIPHHFRCPVSLDLMKDPVTISSGMTYDRDSIEKWLEAGNCTCPVTNQVLRHLDQVPNHTLRKMIQDWCVDNRSYGFERIQTPRVPVTGMDVTEVLYSIQASFRCGDQNGCLESIQKIKKWEAESERNRRCIVENGTASVLVDAFEAFAADSYEKNSMIIEEILSVLNWMFPLGAAAKTKLGSPASLRCMVSFLNSGDISLKQNAVLALNELSSDNQHAEKLASIKGMAEALFKLVNKPICTTITKASLSIIFNIVSLSSPSEKIKSALTDIGIISVLLELLVDSDRSLCEKALGIFDELCCSEAGRQEAYSNDLTMPVLVKKILRVSEIATEFSVSSIWKLCKNENKNGEMKAIIDALQVGAFQKLLLLLQVGCVNETKERATELLKLLNHYRDGLECIETVDFRSLKRSF